MTLHGTVIDPNVPPLALTYAWEQLSGPSVTLTGAGTLDPTFTAPSVTTATPAVFRLVARSAGLDLASDEVSETIQDVSQDVRFG